MSSSVKYKVVGIGIGYRYSIFISTWPLDLLSKKLWVVDILFLDHVVLTQVVVVVVHLVSFLAGWVPEHSYMKSEVVGWVVVMGDYTVISWDWGYLFIPISHPHSQSQSQSLDNYRLHY